MVQRLSAALQRGSGTPDRLRRFETLETSTYRLDNEGGAVALHGSRVKR